MRDNIITALTVAIIVSIVLACNNYTKKTVNANTETTQNSAIINNVYDNNNYSLSPVVTTQQVQNSNNNYQTFTTVSPVTDNQFLTTDFESYEEYTQEYTSEIDTESEEYTDTTTFRSILNHDNETSTTVKQFSIIQNPQGNQQVEQETTPTDFSLTIDIP